MRIPYHDLPRCLNKDCPTEKDGRYQYLSKRDKKDFQKTFICEQCKDGASKLLLDDLPDHIRNECKARLVPC